MIQLTQWWIRLLCNETDYKLVHSALLEFFIWSFLLLWKWWQSCHVETSNTCRWLLWQSRSLYQCFPCGCKHKCDVVQYIAKLMYQVCIMYGFGVQARFKQFYENWWHRGILHVPAFTWPAYNATKTLNHYQREITAMTAIDLINYVLNLLFMDSLQEHHPSVVGFMTFLS